MTLVPQVTIAGYMVHDARWWEITRSSSWSTVSMLLPWDPNLCHVPRCCRIVFVIRWWCYFPHCGIYLLEILEFERSQSSETLYCIMHPGGWRVRYAFMYCNQGVWYSMMVENKSWNSLLPFGTILTMLLSRRGVNLSFGSEELDLKLG